MSAQVNYLGTSVADWVGALSSGDPLQRRLAAYALGEIGPAAEGEVASLLASALEDPSGSYASGPRRPWRRSRRHVGMSVAVLIAELGNELAFVRSLAAWHLGRLGPDLPGIDQALLPLRRLADDGIRACVRRPHWCWGCSKKAAPRRRS